MKQAVKVGVICLGAVSYTHLTDYALKRSDKATKEAEKFINDFVFIECERESVYSKFIYDFNKSKSGNLNRYTFSLDLSLIHI